MAEQTAASNASPHPALNLESGANAASGAEGPGLEETAAIVAVLALMQTEAPVEKELPRASTWARAGRHEAVRPWSRRE